MRNAAEEYHAEFAAKEATIAALGAEAEAARGRMQAEIEKLRSEMEARAPRPRPCPCPCPRPSLRPGCSPGWAQARCTCAPASGVRMLHRHKVGRVPAAHAWCTCVCGERVRDGRAHPHARPGPERDVSASGRGGGGVQHRCG